MSLTSRRRRRVFSGPLLGIMGTLGAFLLGAGAVMMIGYAAGGGTRTAYHAARTCGADIGDTECRRRVDAIVAAVVPHTRIQQSARVARTITVSWDLVLALPDGTRRTARLETQPSGVSADQAVRAEIWRDTITQVDVGDTAYLTTDSPDAYGDAQLVIGGGLAAVGALVAGAAAVTWMRRRRA